MHKGEGRKFNLTISEDEICVQNTWLKDRFLRIVNYTQNFFKKDIHMKNITLGHSYLLEVIGADGVEPADIVLNFLHCEARTEDDDRPKRGEFSVVNPGTTNEEVLRVLIDRLRFLNKKLPCRENTRACIHLELALEKLESRTRDRVERGVESSVVA